ncbi:type VII secretion target [Kitasatospora sp. NBC_01302]|uniref:type VII secretion target n=1 Tax=Kitasatospora sp. NBC_01302 TaxID=2903575 RepID=UPI002E143270|nr:type VII secretion target [Kitasatospora sp. NBC_01302]
MNDISVHPATLRSSANGVQGATGQVGAASGHWLDASSTAAAALTGWQSGSTLKGCTDAWQTHIASIVDQLNVYAGQLSDSAQSYDAAEQEAHRRIAAALTDLNATES